AAHPMLSRHSLPTTRSSAPTRRHQSHHWHLPLLPHPPRPRRHCCWPPPHRTHHHSCSRLTNLLTRCKHSARKRLTRRVSTVSINCFIDRARRSSFHTISVSPLRANSSASCKAGRSVTAPDICSV